MTRVTVIVTSSRDWTDRTFVYEALDIVLGLAKGVGPVIVRHGKCPTGGDKMASGWVSLRSQKIPWVKEEPFPADWNTYGLAAGPVRNKQMVETGADWCLAFIKPCRKLNCRTRGTHGSHGAEGCADLAEAAGIPVKRFRTF